MRGGRLGTHAYGLRHLRRAPDLDALRAAKSPDALARLALIPAARNLGVAAGFLPSELRAEATAALLACRALDAYEDLLDRTQASRAVLNAVDYLTGTVDTPPPPPIDDVAVRDSEAVDVVLAERIHYIRELVAALPSEGQGRIGRMLLDVGGVMARNLDSPMQRTAYSQGVLGRVVLYACTLVAEDACSEADLSELAGCVGVICQLANDLRDSELTLYDAGDRDELTRAVMLRVLAPALGGLAMLARVGPRTPSRGARTAMAYMAITTTDFLCRAVGAPGPYPRRLRLGAAVLSANSSVRWDTMLERVRRSIDGAIHQLLDGSPDLLAASGVRPVSGSAAEVLGRGPIEGDAERVAPLIIDTTFALIHALPDEPLANELPNHQVRRMMVADHLAFGAVERLHPRDADSIRDLANRFQLAAIDTAAPGDRP